MKFFRNLPSIPVAPVLAIAALMLAAVLVARLATPSLISVENAPNLEERVPKAFGDWRLLPSNLVQVGVLAGTETNIDQPYDQTVMRTYVNSRGEHVQLALAWGKRQRQEVKIHRPDLCYVAQGWRVLSLTNKQMVDIRYADQPVLGKRMLVSVGNAAQDAVSYWMRIGHVFSEDAWTTRAHIFTEGLAGRIPDGILVRASARVPSGGDVNFAWELSERFLSDLTAALDPATAAMLVGQPRAAAVQ
jgi:EpsI family protein